MMGKEIGEAVGLAPFSNSGSGGAFPSLFRARISRLLMIESLIDMIVIHGH